MSTFIFFIRRWMWRLSPWRRYFSIGQQRKWEPYFGKRDVAFAPIVQPIIDRVMGAIPLTIYERRSDYLALLKKHDFKLILHYHHRAAFSALPNQVCLGAVALERAWAYSYVCVGAYAQFLSDTRFALEAPEDDALESNIQRCLEWATLDDGLHHEYPADLPRPRANYTDGTAFEKLLTNSFIAAVAWITLHETAHILYGHFGGNPSPEQSRQDELAADRWATDWIMAIAPTKHDRICRLNGVVLGIAIAAYLELRANHEGPRDHPNFPDRLIAALDEFGCYGGNELQQKGLWAMGSVLIYKRALVVGEQGIFHGYEPFKRPRQFIDRASEMFPNG